MTSHPRSVLRRAALAVACVVALGGCGSCVNEEPPAPAASSATGDASDHGAVRLLGRGIDPKKLVARDAGAEPSP